MLVIDEIDSFSKPGQKRTTNERDFNRFLKLVTNEGNFKPKSKKKDAEEKKRAPSNSKRKQRKQSPAKSESEEESCAISVIGIANSVELFRGEISQNQGSIDVFEGFLQKSSYITQNEQKLLFKPYTAEQLSKIVFNLYREHLADFVRQRRRFKSPSKQELTLAEEIRQIEEYELMHPKSFLMAAGKIDKISGDIRVCFEILRETVQRKIDALRRVLPQGAEEKCSQKVSILDVNEVIVELYESKLVRTVKKLPRSHVLLLRTLATMLKANPTDIVKESQLLQMYN